MTAKVLTLGDIGTTWHYSLTARWDRESQREGERDDRRQEFSMRSGRWQANETTVFLMKSFISLSRQRQTPSPSEEIWVEEICLWVDLREHESIFFFFFLPRWGLPTSWKHNIDVSSPYKVVMASVLASSGLFLHIQPTRKNITVVLESCSWHLVSVSPTFTLLLALCCFQPAPEGN